ncbi:hypothetical protein LS73_005175 [Helicobacter muridarum]|nr:hypothetical protein [Helicobacter muridarum]TLE00199.1 hypothetical protein LS73_005175 [Helicobacter muridarum]
MKQVAHINTNPQDISDTNSIKLEKIVTTASGFDQVLSIAPASISVVSPQEILTRPTRDLG